MKKLVMAWGLCATVFALLMLGTSLSAAADPLIHCPRDGKISQCAGHGFVDIITRMLKGDPVHHIPKLDPLLVDTMPINKDAGDILNLNLTFLNLKIEHICEGVRLESSKFDHDELEITMGLYRPLVVFEGNYKMKGKILWLPIWGSGTMVMRMTDVKETFHMKGVRKMGEDGKPYWSITDYSSDLRPRHLHAQFDNLFNGNWILGTGANAFMNNQWKLIYAQLSPITNRHFSRIMKPEWSRILKRINLDEAFPA